MKPDDQGRTLCFTDVPGENPHAQPCRYGTGEYWTQPWRLDPVDDGTHRIINRATGKCLTATYQVFWSDVYIAPCESNIGEHVRDWWFQPSDVHRGYEFIRTADCLEWYAWTMPCNASDDQHWQRVLPS